MRQARLRIPSKSHHSLAIRTGTTMKSPMNIGMKIGKWASLLLGGAVLSTVVAPSATSQSLYYPWRGVSVTQTGGTIASGGAYQLALASSSSRMGCVIQNISAHVLSVYVGNLADATSSNSIQIEPISTTNDGTFRCNVGPFVITGDVNVTTSSTSDKYVVISW